MLSVNDYNEKMVVFVFSKDGEKMSFSNDNLVVKDAMGGVRVQCTCYRIFSLFIVGDASITTGLIKKAQKFGFSIVLMTPSLKAYEIMGYRADGNYLLRRKQYLYSDIEIAKHIVWNKIQCQKEVLDLQRGKDKRLRDGMSLLSEMADSVSKYEGDFRGIMGIEGNAAKVFFRNNYNMVDSFRRVPRIKADFINSTLDIGYTILFNLVDSLLNIYGFDTYQGVYHREFYMRKSLTCDLMEPFRPLIDWQVRKGINLGQCKEEHFNNVNGRYLLDITKNKDYVIFLMKPLIQNKESIFRYFQSYYRAFMKGKGIGDYPVFMVVE